MTHRKARSLILAALTAGLLAIGCSEGGDSPAPTPTKPAASKPAAPKAPSEPAKPAEPAPTETAEAPSPADLAKRGRQVYMANCIACHSQDPAIDGALGPAVAGSSRELVEARVLRAEYPEGYTPKRPSKVMIALPHLGGDIDALTAFLAEAG